MVSGAPHLASDASSVDESSHILARGRIANTRAEDRNGRRRAVEAAPATIRLLASPLRRFSTPGNHVAMLYVS